VKYSVLSTLPGVIAYPYDLQIMSGRVFCPPLVTFAMDTMHSVQGHKQRKKTGLSTPTDFPKTTVNTIMAIFN